MILDYKKRNYINYYHQRKKEQMDIDDYNCGGFALETYNWYVPGYKYFYIPKLIIEKGKKGTLLYYTRLILKDFGNDIRIIHNLKQLKSNEYAVAFRISDSDFHFYKRIKKDVWYHKPGRTKILKSNWKDEEVMNSKYWPRLQKDNPYVYDSDIILFAINKNRFCKIA